MLGNIDEVDHLYIYIYIVINDCPALASRLRQCRDMTTPSTRLLVDNYFHHKIYVYRYLYKTFAFSILKDIKRKSPFQCIKHECCKHNT